MKQKPPKAQAAADSAAASSATLALLPETMRTELVGADRLVASSGAAASIQHNQLKQPGSLAAKQLARTIKAA